MRFAISCASRVAVMESDAFADERAVTGLDSRILPMRRTTSVQGMVCMSAYGHRIRLHERVKQKGGNSHQECQEDKCRSDTCLIAFECR